MHLRNLHPKFALKINSLTISEARIRQVYHPADSRTHGKNTLAPMVMAAPVQPTLHAGTVKIRVVGRPPLMHNLSNLEGRFEIQRAKVLRSRKRTVTAAAACTNRQHSKHVL